jgi:hypothetical protein
MRVLFTLERQFEPIPMPDADVSMLQFRGKIPGTQGKIPGTQY